MRYFEELNKQDWCYLTNIFEPSENQLVLEVTPSFTSNVEEEISVGDKILKGGEDDSRQRWSKISALFP